MKTVTRALILAISAVIIASHTSQAATDKVFCYYGSWAAYRPENGHFDVEDIDPNLCTHVIYSYIGVASSCNLSILDGKIDIDRGALERFVSLKSQNPNLKVIVAQGGWEHASVGFSNCAATAENRQKMVQNVIDFMIVWGFDGYSIDWEYPSRRGGSPADKANYILLLKLFRERFDPLNRLLTASVGVTDYHITLSYNVSQMARYLDFIHLMAYDMFGIWNGFAGHHAPLYASSLLPDAYQSYNVDAVVTNWIALGAPAAKLVLGIPFKGRSFTLVNTSNTTIGASVSSGGEPGRYTQDRGLLSYYEICEKLNAGGWTTVLDNEQKVSYSYRGNQWIGYDNPASVKLKATYAKDKRLGGVMVWSVDLDDETDLCEGGRFPLLTAINEGLGITTLRSTIAISGPGYTDFESVL